MTEIKQAALCICILGAATGLLRMLIPSEKYKTRITFLIACIFSLCLINAVKGIIPSVSIDTQAINVPQVDFSEKLSEQARVTAARAVREKIERLLCDNGLFHLPMPPAPERPHRICKLRLRQRQIQARPQ